MNFVPYISKQHIYICMSNLGLYCTHTFTGWRNIFTGEQFIRIYNDTNLKKKKHVVLKIFLKQFITNV